MAEHQKPELVIYNGRIHTQDPAIPEAAAVAIAQGRFVALGADDEMRKLAGPNTRTVDLGGRRVVPGLTDAHFHLYQWALGRRRLSLEQTDSLADLRERLAERAGFTERGEWILGQGWNETRWPGQEIPTRDDLDDVSPHHPVLLWRSDYHLAVANTRALREAGIDGDTPDPPQGRIDRDAAGRPTGVLRELAIDLVRERVPEPAEDEVVDAVRDGLRMLHRLGLTGVHDHRIMGGADGAPAFRAYQLLQGLGELDLRLWMGIAGEQLDEAIALGLRTGFGDDSLRVGHVKFFGDGSQGARTAWMLEPYLDAEGCGMPLTPMDEIAAAVERADRAGLALAVHAIGDRTNRELITVFERHMAQNARSVPHRIEHAQIVRPADLQRLGRLGVAASAQPLHVTDDIALSESSVGPRSRFAYPFRDMLAAGVTLAFGSDAPVADPNPVWGIHAAVTRQRRDGTPEGGWYPEQRLTVAEAVWGFTMGPAIVTGRGATLGSIAPGKLADLVVLDRDIFALDPAELHEVQVEMTVFDGRVVYER